MSNGSTEKHDAATLENGGHRGYSDGQPLSAALTNSQPAFPVYHRKFANPGILGLFAFASTTLILSLYNVNARHVHVPNIIVGMTMGVGGLGQFMAGMWEFACGNTFGATAFSLYGGFWISFGLIYWPSSGILAAFEAAPEELGNAIGIYLITWFIITFIMWFATHKASIALSATFFVLFITFLLLAAAEFTGKVSLTKAGGYMGIITALVAFYTGAAGLFTPESSYITLPVFPLTSQV